MSVHHTNLSVHVMLATRGWVEWFDPQTAAGLYPLVAGLLRGDGGQLLMIGGTGNHIHLLVRLHPRQSVSDLVHRVRSKSARWVNDRRRAPVRFAWQRGYAAFSVSQSRTEDVMAYIAEQPERHRHMSLEEEIRLLLEKHRILPEPGEPVWDATEGIMP